MKLILLFLTVFLGYGQNAKAFCSNSGFCHKKIELAQGAKVSPDVIAKIQSKFNGRVISVKQSYGGNTAIQILTKNNRVIVVTLDSYGSIISVQE